MLGFMFLSLKSLLYCDGGDSGGGSGGGGSNAYDDVQKLLWYMCS